MIELWLIRHGQTDWNVEGRFQGSEDVPLNYTGREQARKLAKKLDGNSFSAIFSSDLLRAKETAEIIATKLDLPLFIDKRLQEINQGDWEGVLFTEIKEKYPEEIIHRKEDPVFFRPPGGESVEEVSKRITSIVNEISRTFEDEKILIVSHGLALSILICLTKNIPLADAYKHIPDNANPAIVYWDNN